MRTSFLPAQLWALSIFVLASLPGYDIDRIQRSPESQLLRMILSDSFMHFAVFGVLALLIYRGLHRRSKNYTPMAFVALLATGYGFLIELYHAILPWRSFGVDDLFWNTLGVASSLALLSLFRVVLKNMFHFEPL